MPRARVLLAEDHPGVAEQLRAILETEFDVVGVVPDGSALLTAADELTPDVIVTDIAMPRMGGLEATVRLIGRTPHARIVLVTANDEPAVRRRGLAAGALGYVAKFAAEHDLVPAVRAALGARLSAGPSEN
jgi:DNA-binding NarL/FixJ family response regulator